MVVVSFYSSSLTPRTTLLSLVPSPPSCDTTVFSFWHCLYFTFCQAAVRLPIRPFVRPLLFCFERWVEGRRARRVLSSGRGVVPGSSLVPLPFGWSPMTSPLFSRTHGMVSPSAIVLVHYTFCTALGPSGSFAFPNNLRDRRCL